MHSLGKTLEGEKTGEAGHHLRNWEAGPGSVVDRERMRTRARAGRSTPRHPGAALGDVPAPTGEGGSRLARFLVLPLPLGPV